MQLTKVNQSCINVIPLKLSLEGKKKLLTVHLMEQKSLFFFLPLSWMEFQQTRHPTGEGLFHPSYYNARYVCTSLTVPQQLFHGLHLPPIQFL